MDQEPETIEEWEATTKEDGVLMDACLSRRKEDGRIMVWIRVADKIEDFFARNTTGTSSRWRNDDSYHEYYKRKYERGDSDDDMAEFFSDKLDSYGADYVNSGGKVNCGLLRTVGLSDDEGKRFVLPHNYSGDSLEKSLDNLEETVVEIYREFIQPITVVSRVTTYEEVK